MFRTVEATIKKQAREILAKNNWVKSIVGTLMVMSIVSIGILIFNGATLLLSEDILSDIVGLALNVFLSIVALVIFLFLSPLYTGYVRFVDKCKTRETGDINDFFYYFIDKATYMNTVHLNLLLALFYALMFIVCFAPAIVMLVLSKTDMGNQVVFQIVAVWLAIFGVIAFFIVSRFISMTTYLYVADVNYRKETDLIKASVYIVKRNISRVINLFISYLPWVVPCFFVLPLVFVYPYFKHSVVLSYSYIYDMENNNPSSQYFNSNIPLNPQPMNVGQYPTDINDKFNGIY